MNTFIKSLSAIALLISSTFAWSEVVLKNNAFKVVTITSDNGAKSEQWQAPNNMLPSDKVGYQISFTNTGEEAAIGVVIANPIPENTVYVPGSAKGLNTNIEFSVDGGKNFAEASQLFVKNSDELLPASAADYTHVRWTLTNPLAAGAESSVQYAVIIK